MEPKHLPPARALSLGLRLSVGRAVFSHLPLLLSAAPAPQHAHFPGQTQVSACIPEPSLGPCPGHISAAAARETRAKEGRSLTKLTQQRADLGNQGLALLLQYIPLLQAQFKCLLFREAFPATPAQRKGSLSAPSSTLPSSLVCLVSGHLAPGTATLESSLQAQGGR